MASVTGHEISSDFIIADLLAWLKSDHMPAAPVRSTRTPSEPSFASGPFSSSAARTMSFASRAAPAWITAVWRSGEIDRPARGGTTVATAGSLFSLASHRSQRPLESGIGDGLVRRVDDDRQAVAPQPVEVPVDQLRAPGRTRSRSPPIRLPTAPSRRAARGPRDPPRPRPMPPRRPGSASRSSGRAFRWARLAAGASAWSPCGAPSEVDGTIGRVYAQSTTGRANLSWDDAHPRESPPSGRPAASGPTASAAVRRSSARRPGWRPSTGSTGCRSRTWRTRSG